MMSDNKDTKLDSWQPGKFMVMSAEQAEAAFGMLESPVWICCEGIVIYANALAIRLLGVGRNERLVGKEMDRFVTLEAAKQMLAHQIVSVAASGKVENTVVQWSGIEGNAISLGMRMIPIACEEKTAVLMIGRDIAEENNEVRYRKILQLSPEAIFLHSEGVITYVNDSLLRLMDIANANEILGKTIFDFLHPESHPRARLRVEALGKSEGDFPPVHYQVIRQDGEVLEVKAVSKEIFNYLGRAVIQTVLRDITEERRREKTLRDNADWYNRLLKFLPEPIVVADDGVIIFANQSAAKLFKSNSVEQLIGRKIFDLLHPDYYDELTEEVQMLLTSNEPTDFQERKLVCLDGEILQVEVSSIGLDHYFGKKVSLSVIRDLTERKRAEERLLKSEKLSMAGQLAAGIAHEIRNPLTALKGFTRLLQEGKGSLDMFLEIMMSELDRINYIVGEFMNIARPKNAAFDHHNIHDILQGVVRLLEVQGLIQNIVIAVDCEQTLPSLYCDENQLKQVFINLLKNALEAMPNGGEVSISAYMEHSGELTVKVRDEGCGIPQEVLSQLGEPFYTTKEGGTGLGLMVCQRIIQMHQGRFMVESDPGAGTTIQVILPVSRHV